jgi:hypothetical protein
MAHAVTTQTLIDGSRNTIIKVNIKGDGITAAELTNYVIFDASAYVTASTSNKLCRIQYCLNGFSAELHWDATTDVPLISLASDHPQDHNFFNDYMGFAGLVNNAGDGVTGDILITTNGLASSTNDGFIVFYIVEREVPVIR